MSFPFSEARSATLSDHCAYGTARSRIIRHAILPESRPANIGGGAARQGMAAAATRAAVFNGQAGSAPPPPAKLRSDRGGTTAPHAEARTPSDRNSDALAAKVDNCTALSPPK